VSAPRPSLRSLSTAGFALLVWGLGLWLGLASPAAALSDAQQIVVEAWRLVNQSYVDPQRFEAVHWKRLRQKTLERPISSSGDAYDAIDTMLAPLGDPYTRLLRPVDYGSLMANTKGTVSGVGLQLALRSADERIVVIAPLEGSPAAEAGIVSGTAVLAVNGIDTGALGLEGTANDLRGQDGSRVLVLLQEPNGRRRELELQRRQVNLQPVRSKTIRHQGHLLGYLRITQFSEPVPEQVRLALQGSDFAHIEGLILDLRNNSGGLVNAGVAVANALLDRQPILETESRDGIRTPLQASAGQLYGGPMLTLVNGGTASASEILAGSLQDNGRSALLGGRTFGKGLIQTLIPLGDGSGLAVTVARYLTPSGRDIQNLGIEPDGPLAAPEPLNPGGDQDSWLEQALDRQANLLELASANAAQP
jgi:carboxyl-terminal processing protease